MKVRFKKEHCANPNIRVSYDLVTEELLSEWDEIRQKFCTCYEVKGLGFVDVEMMEVTEDENDIPFVDVAVILQNWEKLGMNG